MRIFPRYFISILVLVVVILASLSVAYYQNSRQIVEDMGAASTTVVKEIILNQVAEEGKTLAGVVAESVVTPVMLREYAAISDILRAAKMQSQVYFALVYDDTGRIIHDGTETIPARGKRVDDLFAIQAPFTSHVVWEEKHNRLIAVRPVQIGETLLGGVCIGMGLGRVKESVAGMLAEIETTRGRSAAKSIRDISIVVGLILLCSLMVTYLLARYLSKPVRDLVAFVADIRKSRVTIEVPVTRTDEIGQLARALSDLSTDLTATTVSRDHFLTVLDSMPDGVLVTDGNGRITIANRAAQQLLAMDEAAVMGRTVQQTLPEAGQDIAGEVLAGTSRGRSLGREIILQRIDEPIPCRISASRIGTDDKGTEGTVLLLHDITDIKEAEETIKGQRENLDATLRSITEGVVSTDINGRIVLMNRAAEQMLGSPFDALRGWSLVDIFPVKNDNVTQSLPEILERVLHGGEIVMLDEGFRLTVDDGQDRHIAISCGPIRNSAGEIVGAVLAIRDITDKRRLLEELIKTEKLESLGTLAGGIAHDFNNILTVILGNINYLRLAYEENEKALNNLQQTEKAAYRAQSLTQQLLTFSRGGEPVTDAVAVADLLHGAWQQKKLPEGFQIEYRIPEGIWPVEADPSQLNHVFQNLLKNAMQAMANGGCVQIEVENVVLGEPTPIPASAGKYVRFRFIDHGIGIPDEVINKVFDPYFSTREQGEGLGLATTYSIIKRHGGHIEVDSTEGKGTTVIFYLPVAREAVSPATIDIEQPKVGGGRILLMDDEPMVRDITRELLGFLGYSVQAVGDGEEAIEKYRQALHNGARFACVILDLTIPGGMGGKKTMEKLLALDPHVKAVVASGYSNDPVMAKYESYGFQGVLVKPFSMEQLQRILQSILD